MTTVTINASRSYSIHIGSGLLSSIGSYAAGMGKAHKICIVSETNVFPLHGKTVISSLENSGFEVVSFVFPAGETSKNGITYLNLLNYLAKNQLTRSDLIVALGGGVVGDLAGFAAATYLRGIRFIQAPTTLLSAVDSSVGGKTAIDLSAGKNLAGAFYQPSLVLCDIDTLSTLPDDVFRDGCAEVIKYGVIYDEAFFRYLSKTGILFDREKVIQRCVELKRDVVMEDEFDTGARMKLNLGHTIGHGVEAKSDFMLSHGKSVAIGLSIVCRSAAKAGTLSVNDCEEIVQCLSDYGLPTSTEYTAADLKQFALSDKKRSGDKIPLIIPVRIGYCDIIPTPIDEIESFILAGM